MKPAHLDRAEWRELCARSRVEPPGSLVQEFGVSPDVIQAASVAPAPTSPRAGTTPCESPRCTATVTRPSWAVGRPRRYCSDACRSRARRARAR